MFYSEPLTGRNRNKHVQGTFSIFEHWKKVLVCNKNLIDFMNREKLNYIYVTRAKTLQVLFTRSHFLYTSPQTPTRIKSSPAGVNLLDLSGILWWNTRAFGSHGSFHRYNCRYKWKKNYTRTLRVVNCLEASSTIIWLLVQPEVQLMSRSPPSLFPALIKWLYKHRVNFAIRCRQKILNYIISFH